MNRKNKKKITVICLAITIGMIGLTGCKEAKKEADFTGISSVCQLATLKCYYHNVARGETEASGFFKGLGKGYKKIWTEYSGIVELGIDVAKVKITPPNEKGLVVVTIPDAQILNIDIDENSMQEPLTDKGFMTSITKEEETTALSAAQDNMEETARKNSALLQQAKERAKKTIEGYVKNVGEQMGEEYTVEWKDAE